MSTNYLNVTEKEFFAAVGPRNVHPRAERERSVWIDQETHAVVGISTPGYANGWTAEGQAPRTYALAAKLSGEK